MVHFFRENPMLGDGKTVILSFDDGPAPVTALDSILATLDENEIRAEFYVLGNEVRRYPDAARKIVRLGHHIQNHSWSHIDLAQATERNVRLELERARKRSLKSRRGSSRKKSVHRTGPGDSAAISTRNWQKSPETCR